MLSDSAAALPAKDWYRNFDLAAERARGLPDRTDHFFAGEFRATIAPGGSLTIVASTAATPSLNGEAAFVKRQFETGALLDRFFAANNGTAQAPPPAVQQLVLAADQFIAARPLDGAADAKTILAGYPWFSDWGRDTMIALPGLCLATGRPWLARNILRTFSRFVSEGMLPNQFPRAGAAPVYNTVDATLWYFEAMRQYFEATSDIGLLHELYPVLDRHHRRTRARHALPHSRRSGGRVALCRRTGRATHLDGCEGRRPRRDAAHWKTHRSECAVAQCRGVDGAIRASPGPECRAVRRTRAEMLEPASRDFGILKSNFALM